MEVTKMEKTVAEAIKKLDKLKADELAAELSWCWVSYKNDQNPVGVIEKTEKALELLRAEKEKNDRAVSKKLISDLEKALN
ncbi:hypothetical protein [Algoriphagus namhaensis]